MISNRFSVITAFFCCIMVYITACNSKNDASSTKKYGIVINAQKGERLNDVVIWGKTLDSGIYTTEKGISISNKLGNYIFYLDSCLFSFNKTDKWLTKYAIRDKQFIETGKVRIANLNLLSYSIKLDSSKLYISGNQQKFSDLFVIIDINSMKILQSGSLDLPPDNNRIFTDNFAVLQNNKLHLFYSYFDKDYSFCSDTSYYATYQYPDFKKLSISKDNRSAFPGAGVNDMFNYFKAPNGDMYVLTSPVFYHGNNPHAPTAFYRVKKDADVFDKDYFFNLSALINQQHLLGITYAGNGKVILATSPYPETGKNDIYVADVYKKTLSPVLKNQFKINYVWGTGGFYEKDNGYFVIPLSAHHARIYQYNSATNKLSQGAIITGNVGPESSFKIIKVNN